MKINEWFELYDLSLGLGSDQKLTRDAADIIRAQQERIERLTAELAQLRCDYQCADGDVEYWKSLAAARLADQEAIERHTAKRVAREILLIMEGSESYEDAVSEIRNQYGVE